MRLDLDKAMVPAVYAQCDGLEEIGFIFGSELNCSPVLVRESFEAGLVRHERPISADSLLTFVINSQIFHTCIASGGSILNCFRA